MEDKRMVVFVMMMLTIGNLMSESEASIKSFMYCYGGCFELCLVNPLVPIKLTCPIICSKECSQHSEIKLNEIDQIGYFCEIGCVTHRCVPVQDQSKFFATNINFILILVYTKLLSRCLYVYISLS